LGLGNGSWDLGQGLLILAESLLIYFGLVLVKWGTGQGLLILAESLLIYFGFVFVRVLSLEPFCMPSKHLVANKPFVYWIRFEKLFLVSFLLVFVN
jgi:hypothetical protein